MNAWPFVIAAYSIALGAAAVLTLLSYVAMKRTER